MKTNAFEFITYVNLTLNVFNLAVQFDVLRDSHRTGDVSVLCPFHGEGEGSHISARLYQANNCLYCFKESRGFYPYDFLTKLGGMTFNDVWAQLGVQFLEFKKKNPNAIVAQDPSLVLISTIEEDPSIRKYSEGNIPFNKISSKLNDYCFKEI